MKKLFIVLAFLISVCTAFSQDWMQLQKQHDYERATYWATKGYQFNPKIMTAWLMDQKVKDIERARYWATQGYKFNPDVMGAWAMDQKVRDIRRAKYWKEKGYTFDPNLMTAWAMDQKVNDIERSTYWAKRGYKFDPNLMTAWAMDQEVRLRTSTSQVSLPQYLRSISLYPPSVAENGDISGTDNDGDGRVEPVFVRGYYRKDGTYVRSHYRAKPRK